MEKQFVLWRGRRRDDAGGGTAQRLVVAASTELAEREEDIVIDGEVAAGLASLSTLLIGYDGGCIRTINDQRRRREGVMN